MDKPKEEIPLNDYRINIDRGPFTVENDISLLKENRIELVVSKNSGGSGAYAKIAAARKLGLPVIMINRPKIPHARKSAKRRRFSNGWIMTQRTLVYKQSVCRNFFQSFG